MEAIKYQLPKTCSILRIFLFSGFWDIIFPLTRKQALTHNFLFHTSACKVKSSHFFLSSFTISRSHLYRAHIFIHFFAQTLSYQYTSYSKTRSTFYLLLLHCYFSSSLFVHILPTTLHIPPPTIQLKYYLPSMSHSTSPAHTHSPPPTPLLPPSLSRDPPPSHWGQWSDSSYRLL